MKKNRFVLGSLALSLFISSTGWSAPAPGPVRTPEESLAETVEVIKYLLKEDFIQTLEKLLYSKNPAIDPFAYGECVHVGEAMGGLLLAVRLGPASGYDAARLENLKDRIFKLSFNCQERGGWEKSLPEVTK